MKDYADKFDPAERRREKEISRESDERALASGEKSPRDLQRENGHFAGLNVRINLGRAKALY